MFRIAYLKAGIDKNESYKYILRGLNESILRHGWRKDYIVDTNLVSAFELMVDKRYINHEEIVEAAYNIIDMILILTHTTDERWRGIELADVIKVLDKIDIEESTKLVDAIVSRNAHSNDMLYDHLKTKIIRGHDVNEIYNQIIYFDHNEGTGRTIVYQLGIYLQLFYSHWYSDEKESLQEKISTIVRRNNFGLTDELETDSYKLLKRFCEEYNVDCNISEKETCDEAIEEMNDNTKIFIDELKKCKSKRELNLLCERLFDYNMNIRLLTEDSWKLLVDKTKPIYTKFEGLIDYFSKNDYPHASFYSRNSKDMFIGLGYAIKAGIDKRQLYDFVLKKGGHDGFVQLIYSYAFIEDKEMCRKLFWRFMDICKLLVLM